MSKHLSKHPARVRKQVDRLARGIAAKLGNGKTVMAAGVVYDQAQLLARMQAIQKAHDDVDEARRQLSAKVSVRERVDAENKGFLEELAIGLRNAFGLKNPALAAFGVPYDRPRRQPSVENKVISYAEGVRTRRARGSYTSAKQRKEITVEGKPGLVLVAPDGKLTEILPPAPPRKPRPKRK